MLDYTSGNDYLKDNHLQLFPSHASNWFTKSLKQHGDIKCLPEQLYDEVIELETMENITR